MDVLAVVVIFINLYIIQVIINNYYFFLFEK